MKSLAVDGNLKGRKVNHSTRKTFATTLVHAGLPPTEVAQLGGWKNLQSINDYSVPSIDQQCAASSVLSNTITPQSENKENVLESTCTTDNAPECVEPTINACANDDFVNTCITPVTSNAGILVPSVSSPPETDAIVNIPSVGHSQHLLQYQSMAQGVPPFSLFMGATISGGTININLAPPPTTKHMAVASRSSSQE